MILNNEANNCSVDFVLIPLVVHRNVFGLKFAAFRPPSFEDTDDVVLIFSLVMTVFILFYLFFSVGD